MSKKFRSPNGKPIRVALLSGHVAIIGDELRDLPEQFWNEAYAQGAVSDDMKVPSTADYLLEQKKLIEQKEAEELVELKNLLISIYDSPKDLIDGKGKPVQRKIVQMLGRPVKKDLIDSLWDEVVAEQPVEA